MSSSPHYFMDETIRRMGLTRWLWKGGRRRAQIREAVRSRAAGRCEVCGDDADMHDGKSGYGGTYVLLDESEAILPDNIRLVHRGCIPEGEGAA